MKEIKINVEGMSCGGCENRIKNVLKDVKNVIEVDANCGTGIVVIKYEEEIDKKQISELIEDLGFKVKE